MSGGAKHRQRDAGRFFCPRGFHRNTLVRYAPSPVLHAQEILNLKKRLNEIYVKHTGQLLKKIEDALERDLCFPKIISGRNGDAARTRLGLRQWHRSAGPPDPGARLCPTLSACAPHCSTPHNKKEFAAGVPHQRSASGPGTRGARCQSDAPHTRFAMAIQVRSVGRGCPWLSPVT